MTALLVAVGAAVGAPCRYLVGHVLDGRLPVGTLLVNLVGCLLLGWFSALGLSGHQAALLGTGFCGSLTTYSAFTVHAVDLGGRTGTAYALVTVAGGLAACALGFALGA